MELTFFEVAVILLMLLFTLIFAVGMYLLFREQRRTNKNLERLAMKEAETGSSLLSAIENVPQSVLKVYMMFVERKSETLSEKNISIENTERNDNAK